MTLTDEERENAAKLAADLRNAFIWKKTPQGSEYWGNIVDQLINLTREED